MNAHLVIPYAKLGIIANKYDLKATQTEEKRIHLESFMDDVWNETVDLAKTHICI